MTRFFMSELVEALEYLHSNNIIHMDLKPESKYICVYMMYSIYMCVCNVY